MPPHEWRKSKYNDSAMCQKYTSNHSPKCQWVWLSVRRAEGKCRSAKSDDWPSLQIYQANQIPDRSSTT